MARIIGQQFFDAAGQLLQKDDIVYTVLPGRRLGLFPVRILRFSPKQCTVIRHEEDGRILQFPRYYSDIIKPGESS